MSWIMIVVVIVAGVMLLTPLLTYLSSRRLIGKRVDAANDSPVDRLIYFYSPHCGPCRGMTPIIDQLADEHTNIMKIDISRDLASARQFGIRATPTTVLVENNQVKKVLLGAKSKKQLERLLDLNG